MSRLLFVGGERCPVALFKSFVERTSVANETENLNIWFKLKPMGANTITNIMKVSVAGTSLKESEKKVYES